MDVVVMQILRKRNFQIGPGVVYLFFDAGIFGKGVLFHHVTPEGPLLQKLTHNLYFGWRMPGLGGKLLLLAEALQVRLF